MICRRNPEISKWHLVHPNHPALLQTCWAPGCRRTARLHCHRHELPFSQGSLGSNKVETHCSGQHEALRIYTPGGREERQESHGTGSWSRSRSEQRGLHYLMPYNSTCSPPRSCRDAPPKHARVHSPFSMPIDTGSGIALHPSETFTWAHAYLLFLNTHARAHAHMQAHTGVHTPSPPPFNFRARGKQVPAFPGALPALGFFFFPFLDPAPLV